MTLFNVNRVIEISRKISSQWMTIIVLCISAVLSLLFSIGSVIFIDPRENWSIFKGIIMIILYLSCLTIPIIAVVISVLIAFQKRHKATQLQILLTAYVVIIIIFAGYYYSITYFQDYNDSIHRHINYETELIEYDSGLSNTIFTDFESERAFPEMRDRFWRLGEFSENINDEIRRIREIVSIPIKEAIFLNKEKMLPIFINCLHFSVLSMSLVGYDTYTNLDWQIKLGNSLQILVGTFLLVVLLGMLFANWHIDSSSNIKENPNKSLE